MESFAFISPPSDARPDVRIERPRVAQAVPDSFVNVVRWLWPTLLLSRVSGVRSRATGRVVEGWGVRCPLSARQMRRLAPQVVYDRVVQAGRLAQRQGAGILGLGPLASAVGDGGVTVAQRLNMPVTTGNSLTVAAAVAAAQKIVEVVARRRSERGARLSESPAGEAPPTSIATAAVVGASSGIGLGCAEMLAPLVGQLILVGRREIHLSRARALAEAAGAAGKVRVSTRVEDIREADLVLSAGHVSEPSIQPDHLKPNAIVCDVAPPTHVSPAVRRERSDVLLIVGGLVEVPGMVDLGSDVGVPAGQAYAYMGEVMVLALEGRYESFSLGQRVHTDKVREIAQLARKHGFRLTPQCP